MAFVEFSRRAPTGFLIVPDDGDPEDDDQTALIQTDWDWPGVARSMGWSGEDNQFEEAYHWIREHEGEEFEGLDDYLPQENPCMSANPMEQDFSAATQKKMLHRARTSDSLKVLHDVWSWAGQWNEGGDVWVDGVGIIGTIGDRLRGAGKSFDDLMRFERRGNPGMCGNPGTADSWNAGREWALADAASGISQQYTAEAWERWARAKDWTGYTQKDLDNSRRNFIHAYEQAMGRRGKRNPVPNGRSYVRRGVNPDMDDYDRTFKVRGMRGPVTIHHSGVDPKRALDILFPDRVHDKAWHEKQARYWQGVQQENASEWSRLFEEGYREAYGKAPGVGSFKVSGVGDDRLADKYKNRLRAFAQGSSRAGTLALAHARKAGLKWTGGGHYTTPMSNPRDMSLTRDWERAFNEGYAIGKRTGRTGNPQTGVDRPMSWDLASFARSKYSRRAAHIKAVTDYLIKLRDEGNYNLKAAAKAYYYVIEGAAKEYAKEYGSKSPSPAVKLEAARDLMSMVEGGR
jgi:hypothetical protein